jgi:hypothetical protein
MDVLRSTGFSLCSVNGPQLKPHRLKPVLLARAVPTLSLLAVNPARNIHRVHVRTVDQTEVPDQTGKAGSSRSRPSSETKSCGSKLLAGEVAVPVDAVVVEVAAIVPTVLHIVV